MNYITGFIFHPNNRFHFFHIIDQSSVIYIQHTCVLLVAVSLTFLKSIIKRCHLEPLFVVKLTAKDLDILDLLSLSLHFTFSPLYFCIKSFSERPSCSYHVDVTTLKLNHTSDLFKSRLLQ